MSTVGESSIGDITLTNSDNGKDNRVRAEVHRYKVTWSYNYAYICLSCKKQHSVLDPENITIVIDDQFSPDTLPKNTDGTCLCLIRFHCSPWRT